MNDPMIGGLSRAVHIRIGASACYFRMRRQHPGWRPPRMPSKAVMRAVAIIARSKTPVFRRPKLGEPVHEAPEGMPWWCSPTYMRPEVLAELLKRKAEG